MLVKRRAGPGRPIVGCPSEENAMDIHTRRRATIGILTLALLPSAGWAAPWGAGGAPFAPDWFDGKAELAGYELTQSRYGQERAGRAVLIFVTEPYSRSERVKVDRFDPANPDHAQVLKLNHVRKFQTGIYDYSLMTSVFSDVEAGFRPLEVSFSSQEWCGHVYEEALFGFGDDGDQQVSVHSYFEGESTDVEIGGDLVAEDALPILLRSLDREKLDTANRSLRLLPSATFRRLRHRPAEPFTTELTWTPDAARVTVPAGSFETRSATHGRADGGSCTFSIEVPYPHRIVAWTCSDGESARLTGTTRLDYWRTHREGEEALLGTLGLAPSVYEPATR